MITFEQSTQLREHEEELVAIASLIDDIERRLISESDHCAQIGALDRAVMYIEKAAQVLQHLREHY